MSATIDIGKLKFSVFGNGFEGSRTDSGNGENEPKILNYMSEYAAIDITGEYIWLVTLGQTKQYRISNWTNTANLDSAPLYHPCNVENNYGVSLISSTRVLIFDLTTGETIKDITTPAYSSQSGLQDCILVEDAIYLVKCTAQRDSLVITEISLEDETVTSTTVSGTSVCGFSSDTTIYGYWAKEWFSQVSSAYSWNKSATGIWTVTETHEQNFRTHLHGLCGNGFLYLPTPEDGVWKLGVYDAYNVPDFITPNPIRTFGRFASSLEFSSNVGLHYCYNHGKTKAVFSSNIGTYYTDFSSIKQLHEDQVYMMPLAMNDKMVISNVGNQKTSIYQF